MEKLLTVVIPSYNVEQYLNQTLESFVIDSQWLEKLEILIVDDGSKDHTADIGKEYEHRYPGIFHVISKENGGHGSTINRGIQEAKGKYFKVVDGDDWVDSNGFQNFVKMLEKCDTDFVIANYYEVNDQSKQKTEKTFPQLEEGKKMNLEEVITKIQIPMHALTIKTDILKTNKIKLDEHCFYVDVEYVLYPIPYVKDVTYINEFVYMYRLAVATQSVSMAGYQKHMQNHIDVIFHVLDYINAYKEKADYDKLKELYMARRIAEMVHGQVDVFISFGSGDKVIQKKFKEFDAEVKEKNAYVYEKSGEFSGMLRLLRKSGFRFYSLIVRLSKVRNG